MTNESDRLIVQALSQISEAKILIVKATALMSERELAQNHQPLEKVDYYLNESTKWIVDLI